jgi:hypothetical protein
VRSQLTQEKVQNWTTTTFPRSPAGVSGSELSQAVAPSNDGNSLADSPNPNATRPCR